MWSVTFPALKPELVVKVFLSTLSGRDSETFGTMKVAFLVTVHATSTSENIFLPKAGYQSASGKDGILVTSVKPRCSRYSFHSSGLTGSRGTPGCEACKPVPLDRVSPSLPPWDHPSQRPAGQDPAGMDRNECQPAFSGQSTARVRVPCSRRAGAPVFHHETGPRHLRRTGQRRASAERRCIPGGTARPGLPFPPRAGQERSPFVSRSR